MDSDSAQVQSLIVVLEVCSGEKDSDNSDSEQLKIINNHALNDSK